MFGSVEQPAPSRKANWASNRPRSSPDAIHRSETKYLPWLITWLILALVVPFTLGLPLLPWSLTSASLYILLYISSGLVGLQIVADGTRPFLAIYGIFTYIWMAVAPISQLYTGKFPATATYRNSGISRVSQYFSDAAFLTLLAALIFLLSYRIRSPLGLIANGARRHVVNHRPRMLDAWILTLVSLVAIGILIAKTRDPLIYLRSREAVRLTFESMGVTISFRDLQRAFASAPPLVVLISSIVRARGLRHAYNPAASGVEGALLAWISSCLLLLTANPISTPRYWSMTVILSVAWVSAAYGSRKTVHGLLLAAVLAGGLVVFGALDSYRRVGPFDNPISSQGNAPVIELNSIRSPKNYLSSSGDYDAWLQIANVIAYVDGSGLRKGSQLAGAILFPIPRSMFPNKPVSSGIIVGDWLEVQSKNLSAPTVAELYLDFGYAGSIVGSAALGALIAWLDRAYLQSDALSRALLIPLAFYSIIGYRGSLQSILPLGVSYCLLAYSFWRRARLMER